MTPERVVVIGASAGGVRALEQVLEGLPGDFPAPVLVTLHISPTHKSLLPDILSRAGTLKVEEAANGKALRGGRVYVAPPDHHLMLDAERVLVTHGPRENHFRPSTCSSGPLRTTSEAAVSALSSRARCRMEARARSRSGGLAA